MAQLKEDTLLNKTTLMLSNVDFKKIPNAKIYNNIDEISDKEILKRAEEAKIFDERDEYLLSEKLNACIGKKNIILLIDAIDDEPYITSQMCTIVHYKEKLIKGIELALKATGAQKCIIETYLKNSSNEVKKIFPRKISKYPILALNTKYPADIRMKKLWYDYRDNRYIYIGACSLVHLARAVYQGIEHKTTIITVAGNAVKHPQNIEAEIGLPVSDLLERTGFSVKPTRIILGGSLTGEAIRDIDSQKIKISTQGILAIHEKEIHKDYGCIRCGKCIDVCPSRLNPMQLYKNIISRDDETNREIDKLDSKMCVSCMCCSYVCPSKINIAETILLYNRRNRFKNEV